MVAFPRGTAIAAATNPMHDEHTSMEVEGAKSASTIASASDATATGPISGLGSEVHREGVHRGEASGGSPAPERSTATPSIASVPVSSGREAAANEPAAPAARTDADQDDDSGSEPPPPGKARQQAQTKKHTNNLRKLRIERMMSKAELARRANLSVLTIDRIEKGFGCRMDSKRKILEALGLSLADRVRVFGEEE